MFNIIHHPIKSNVIIKIKSKQYFNPINTYCLLFNLHQTTKTVIFARLIFSLWLLLLLWFVVCTTHRLYIPTIPIVYICISDMPFWINCLIDDPHTEFLVRTFFFCKVLFLGLNPTSSLSLLPLIIICLIIYVVCFFMSNTTHNMVAHFQQIIKTIFCRLSNIKS